MGHTSMVNGCNTFGPQNGHLSTSNVTHCVELCCMGQATLKTKGRVRCDNCSLVDVITKGSFKEEMVIHLLRSH